MISSSSVQKVVRLMKRPVGMVKPGVDLVVGTSSVLDGGLQDSHFLVRNLFLSLDPAMRGWMNDAKSYIEPVKIGDAMRGGCVGEVVESNNPKFPPGKLVTGMFGWQEYAHVKDPRGVHVVPPVPGLPPSAFLGVLGMTGMTAYFGLLDVGKPKAGETILVSGAAGATGSVVGQIAKHVMGCRVVGIAGGKKKCDWLVSELGFDAAIDYKSAADSREFYKLLKDATPEGVDVYFDNVGGDQLDAALLRINQGARVVICGAISQYNALDRKGPVNYMQLLVRRASMTGFLVFDYASKFPEAGKNLAQWILEGKIKFKEHVVDGIENAPDALLQLFTGGNFGKLVVKIADPEASSGSEAAPTSRL